MRKTTVFVPVFLTILSLVIGYLLGDKYGLPFLSSNPLISPLVEKTREKSLPLLKYSITNLQQYPFQASKIVIENELQSQPQFTSYVFSYKTREKTMMGQINVPSQTAPTDGFPVIIMMRGWVPEENYTSGTGTKPAAAVYASNGYVTIAPDFFGYGGSDPKPANEWEERFEKPINTIELLKTIETQKNIELDGETITLDTNRIGFWAHSNGGQITLATLEVLERPIPATLWAPVTAPFPYSVLFFTDEDEDEGKQFRKYLANFEEEYDVFDFTLTKHLDKLTGPIQIHQGTADDAVLFDWSKEFVDKLEKENELRENVAKELAKRATPSTEVRKTPHPPIDIQLFIYPGADHNLRPGWDTVVQRDLNFFAKEL